MFKYFAKVHKLHFYSFPKYSTIPTKILNILSSAYFYYFYLYVKCHFNAINYLPLVKTHVVLIKEAIVRIEYL